MICTPLASERSCDAVAHAAALTDGAAAEQGIGNAEADFRKVNKNFAVLDETAAANLQLRSSLATLEQEVWALQHLVEGCVASAGSCPHSPPAYPSPDLNACDAGAHPIGMGAQLSNGNINPACRNPEDTADVACPCCPTCQVMLAVSVRPAATTGSLSASMWKTGSVRARASCGVAEGETSSDDIPCGTAEALAECTGAGARGTMLADWERCRTLRRCGRRFRSRTTMQA